MTNHRTPFGTRLSRRLLPFRDTDALLGDITEELRHRSRGWYWAQIAAVIVVGSFRDVRRHPLMTVRAIVVGCASLFAYFGMFATLVNAHVFSFHSAFEFYVFLICAFYGGLATSGWVVGRLHRPHGIALVVAFAISVPILLELIAIVARFLVPAASQARLIASWVDVVKILAIPISILLGGYSATRRVDVA
jgi:hypothetical protein